MNIDLSINIGISIGESICINTNIHMMMCIRRNTCSSITLYFLIRIPPDLEPKRGVALEDFPNSLWAGAEAVTDTRMQPKPKNKNPKFHGECRKSFVVLVVWWFCFLFFWIFVFLYFLGFWFYIAKPKNEKQHKQPKTKNPKHQQTKTPKNQKHKKPKLCRHSP